MTHVKTLLILSLALLAAGCLPTLQPLYTKETLATYPPVIGTWVDKNSKDRWWFAAGDGPTSYTLTITDAEGKKGTVAAQPLTLNKQIYLDFFPGEDNQVKLPGFLVWHLQPVHTFAKVNVVGDTLSMTFLDANKVAKFAKQNPDLLPAQETDSRLIITATTAQLQAFVSEQADEFALWGKTLEMTRLVDPPDPAE